MSKDEKEKKEEGAKETGSTTTSEKKVEKAPETALTKIKEEAIKLFPKDIAKQTKHILDNSPHVNFIVPKADWEPQGAYETVQINGHKYTIMKGVMVNVPEQVAKLIAEKYRINAEIGKDKRVDTTPEKTSALS